MVFIAEAIVNKGAMMIEFLNAMLAMSAVEGSSRFYNSAVKAEVVKIYAFFVC